MNFISTAPLSLLDSGKQGQKLFRPLRIDLLPSFASFGISWSDPYVEYIRIMTPVFSPPRIIDMQSLIHNCGKPQFHKKFIAIERISISKSTLKIHENFRMAAIISLTKLCFQLWKTTIGSNALKEKI